MSAVDLTIIASILFAIVLLVTATLIFYINNKCEKRLNERLTELRNQFENHRAPSIPIDATNRRSVYHPVPAGDAEGTAIAIAYELWLAELVEDVRNNGPKGDGTAGSAGRFTANSAYRIGYWARLIVRKLREDEGDPFSNF